MKKQIKKLFGNYYFLSFLLGALVYYMFLSYSQLAGGKYVILEGDGLDAYAANMKAFCDNILNGKGILYSWSISLGANGFLAIPAFSLTNIIYLLLYKFDVSTVTIITLVLKSGVVSLFFYLYISKIWKIEGVRALIFSILYALCAYQVAYMPVLIGYVDTIFMLPLLLYACSIFADKGNIKILCFAYLYSFINYYYTAYMLGFFTLIYLCLYMLIIKRYTIKCFAKKLILFGVCIIIVGGVSMIVNYPIATYLFTGYAEDATQIASAPASNIIDVYNQLFIGQNSKILNVHPYIYCGLIPLFLLPLYLISKKISKNEKILDISLLLLMIISGFITPLYLFWHCFDAPDNFFYRYSFIISFLLCVIGCKASVVLFDFKKRVLALIVFLNMLFYVGYMYIKPLFIEESFFDNGNNWEYFGVNLLFGILYLGWIFIYDTYGKKEKYRDAILLIIILITGSEAIVNGYSTYFKQEWLTPSNYYDTYKLWQVSTGNALNSIYEDGGEDFYRINCVNDYTTNGAIFFNYKGISYFSNLENYKVRKCLESLGVASSPRIVQSYGMTDFTNMIFDVRYNIDSINYGSHKDYVLDYNQNASVYKNNYCLSLGFMVDDSILDFAFPGRNQFLNINDLASCMTGKELKLYDILTSGLTYDEVGINLVETDEGNVVLELQRTPGAEYNVGLFFFNIPLDEREAYVQLEYGSSAFDRSAPYLIDCITGDLHEYERLGASYIKKMTRLEETYSVGICMGDDTYDSVLVPNELIFAYYNYDEFLKAYDALKENQMKVIEYGNGYVHSRINNLESGKILFTSIPYDNGWEVWVNGVESEIIPLLDGAFIGIDLPEGECDIVFRYHVPGLKTGIIITIIFIIILLSLFKCNPKIQVEFRSKNIKNRDNDIEVKNDNEKIIKTIEEKENVSD